MEGADATAASWSADEWVLLSDAPWIVAVGVMSSDPSGPISTGRELDATLVMLRDGVDDPAGGPLVRAVCAALVDRPLPDLRVDPGATHRSLRHCEQVVSLLSTRPGSAGPAFRRWLHRLGHAVADAAVDRGFLGLRGPRVSEAEQLHLDDLADALGLVD
ncbi:MAG: hypothetical protein AAFZ07_19970 [Actinomycetota bacterium]